MKMTKLEMLEKEYRDAAEAAIAAWAIAYDKWQEELKRVELEKLKDEEK